MAKDKTTTDRKEPGNGKAKAAAAASAVRSRIAQVVWLICVLCALVLALGALLVALKANGDNTLVQFIKETAGFVDLGVFDRNDGVLKFTGDNAVIKNALVNWGLAAVVWLIIGRILDRIIRP
ncbi:MAG: hypothetical protein JWN68_626 [Nocardioides sp.]|uniref:hypothetical protein n=1 Tax=Nocardioides sp. TaxID=35761 RepID=UPI002607E564|nr:hypothetical protein [Nocardioides sp.]MCW2832673.1 hypothetical protein [Nocardioides sp.]